MTAPSASTCRASYGTRRGARRPASRRGGAATRPAGAAPRHGERRRCGIPAMSQRHAPPCSRRSCGSLATGVVVAGPGLPAPGLRLPARRGGPRPGRRDPTRPPGRSRPSCRRSRPGPSSRARRGAAHVLPRPALRLSALDLVAMVPFATALPGDRGALGRAQRGRRARRRAARAARRRPGPWRAARSRRFVAASRPFALTVWSGQIGGLVAGLIGLSAWALARLGRSRRDRARLDAQAAARRGHGAGDRGATRLHRPRALGNSRSAGVPPRGVARRPAGLDRALAGRDDECAPGDPRLLPTAGASPPTSPAPRPGARSSPARCRDVARLAPGRSTSVNRCPARPAEAVALAAGARSSSHRTPGHDHLALAPAGRLRARASRPGSAVPCSSRRRSSWRRRSPGRSTRSPSPAPPRPGASWSRSAPRSRSPRASPAPIGAAASSERGLARPDALPRRRRQSESSPGLMRSRVVVRARTRPA